MGRSCTSGDSSSGDLCDAIQKRLDQAVKKNKGCGGGMLRLEDNDGNVIFQGASGRSGHDKCPDLQCDFPLETASVSKMFTAAVVLQLAEAGTISLGDPIVRYLDGKVDDIDGFAVVEGEEVLEHITVEMCLNHTTGLPEYWDSEDFKQSFKSNPTREYTPAECLTFACGENHFFPGTEGRFYYADTNYILLGYMIENVEEECLEDVYVQRIFEPLGMEDTYTRYRQEKRGCRDKPICHRFETKMNVCGQVRQTAEWAGGGLVSTLEDLAIFVRGFLSEEATLISKETRDGIRNSFNPTEAFFGTDDITYGHGVMRVVMDCQGQLWGHDGHGNAFAYYWLKKGIICTGTLNQLDNDWCEMMLDVCQILTDHDAV